MSAPPPGYNPGDSLLQGGNAPIHAVQGGGGSVAPEDQSLLTGGNSAEIHPVQGGGAAEDQIAEVEAELRRIADDKSPAANELKDELTERLRIIRRFQTWLETPKADAPDPPDPERHQKGETGWAYWQRTGKGLDEEDHPDDPIPMEQFLSKAFLAKLGVQPPPSGSPPPPVQQAIQQPGLQLGEADINRLRQLLESLDMPEPGTVDAAAAVRRQKALGSVVAERSSVELPARPSISDYTKRFQTLIKAYIQKQGGLWKRKTIGTVVAPAAAQRITNERCPPIRSLAYMQMAAAAASEDLGGFDRLVTFLPKTLQRIFLYPAIQGKSDILGRCISHAQITSLGPNDALIFRAPIFSTASAENKKIFAQLLHLKANSPAWVYFPPEHTSLNRVNGCQLDPNYERGAQVGTDPIPNFLEPSYLVFSHPELELEKKPKRGILFTTAKTGGNNLPLSKQEGGTPYASVESLIKIAEDNGSFCIVTNLDSIDPTVGDLEVVSLRDMGGTPNQRIDVIYLSRADKAASVDAVVRQLPNQFVPSRSISSKDAALATKVVTLGTREYKIRDPGMEGVYDDWVRMEFTEDEANFLMDLNLRPKMLATIFKDETDPVTRLPLRWQEVLAGFLRNILDSNCFTDDTLLTRGECQQGRRFVNRILQYFMEHDEEIANLSDTELNQLQKMLINRVDEADTLAQLRAIEAERERTRALTALSGEEAARGQAAAAEAAGKAQADAAAAGLAAAFGGPAGLPSERDPYKEGVVKFNDDILDPDRYFSEIIKIISPKAGDEAPSKVIKESAIGGWKTIDEALAKLKTMYPAYTFSK